ncbi:hypothetical protein B0H16DRAFT_1602885 [Mycena metata]|uniref:Uncharacterized protein n=1 Tax=Mycena metata TaxID=1033252 RepID=A0AAD7HI50_9AGAR|nr:hypothetical protein B0H16DRAFT_1602885 [Mycena metata]
MGLALTKYAVLAEWPSQAAAWASCLEMRSCCQCRLVRILDADGAERAQRTSAPITLIVVRVPLGTPFALGPFAGSRGVIMGTFGNERADQRRATGARAKSWSCSCRARSLFGSRWGARAPPSAVNGSRVCSPHSRLSISCFYSPSYFLPIYPFALFLLAFPIMYSHF